MPQNSALIEKAAFRSNRTNRTKLYRTVFFKKLLIFSFALIIKNMSMIKYFEDADTDFFFIFHTNCILVKTLTNAGGLADELPDADIYKKCIDHQIAKDWFTEPQNRYAAMTLAEAQPLPKGYTWVPLRSLFASGHPAASLAARAAGIINWRQGTRFCSSCGGQLTDDKYDTARQCSLCGREFFPSLSPCIIVLVKKDGKMLLARHLQRNSNVYTCLAGYMEPGETIEQCVEREVFEETGIKVKNIRYVKSQSWPFPDQLMIGCHADYDSGDIKVQQTEIQEALWFSPDELPAIPPPGSLAWELITGKI